MVIAKTDAAQAADDLFAQVLNENEMVTLRERAEEARKSHGPAHLGANHYFEALVELGWPDELAVRLKRKFMG